MKTSEVFETSEVGAMRRTSGKQDSGPHPAQSVPRRTKRRIIELNTATEISLDLKRVSHDLNFGVDSPQYEEAGGTRTSERKHSKKKS